jgi:FAD/FMN-containing dehydrogenase
MEDGEIHRLGSGLLKDNAGPSLAQLMVGSEGIFGIITAARVRLMPIPTERMTLLLPIAHWEDLFGLPALLASNGMMPCAFEFWDPAVLQCLRRHGPEEAKRLPGEALAVIEFDDAGCTASAFLDRLLGILGPLSSSVQAATDHRQREAIWDIRRQTSVVLKEQFPNKISEDIAVPRSKIKDFFEGAENLKLPMATYGHLGDGNLHANLLINNNAAETEKNIMSIFRLAVSLGGTLTGEHGIGLAKREAFLALADPWQIDAIRSIKKALDPCGIFNAGKVV